MTQSWEMYVRHSSVLLLVLLVLASSEAHRLQSKSQSQAQAQTHSYHHQYVPSPSSASSEESFDSSPSSSNDYDDLLDILTTRSRRSAKRVQDYVKPGKCGSEQDTLQVCFTCGRYTGSFELYEQCCMSEDVHAWCAEWLAVGESN